MPVQIMIPVSRYVDCAYPGSLCCHPCRPPAERTEAQGSPVSPHSVRQGERGVRAEEASGHVCQRREVKAQQPVEEYVCVGHCTLPEKAPPAQHQVRGGPGQVLH